MSGSIRSVRSRDSVGSHGSYGSGRSKKHVLHPSESISAVDIDALPNGIGTFRRSGSSEAFMPPTEMHANDIDKPVESPAGITKTGLRVLILLAVQNATKNLLLRYVMVGHPKFLTSAAVIGIEVIKLVLSLLYIRLVERQSFWSAMVFMKVDKQNTLLMVVPAILYSIQMSLEYVALGNLDAAVFSVLVQTKLLATAGCAVLVLRKKIKKVQVISLFLLTIGVMMCNMKNIGNGGGDSVNNTENDGGDGSRRLTEEVEFEVGDVENEHINDTDEVLVASIPDTTVGILATVGIAACSGLASVYTEKVIKAKRPQKEQQSQQPIQYGLAYTQVQLAVVSLFIIGIYCILMELDVIMEKGLFYGFDGPALLSIFNGAIGGLIVAAVLKYADAILKGYATAFSIILTGISSMIIFDTRLNVLYFLGIGNVTCAVLLYSATDLDRLLC